MSISPTEHGLGYARDVSFSGDALVVELIDGRTLMVPISWYPRLLHASPAERAHWRLIGNGAGIHWPDLDEDISLEGLLAGRRSGETSASIHRWLAARKTD
jgi:hypothetical protein